MNIKSVLSICLILVLWLTLPFTIVSYAESNDKNKKKEIKRVDNMIAVFDLDSRGKVDKNISMALSDSIRLELLKSGQFELVDRGNMDKIFSEQKLQLSGCVSGQCVVEAGQLLGVGKIITGSVNKLGNTFYLSLSLINTETGKLENVSEDKCKCEVDELIDASKRLVKRLLGEDVAADLEIKNSIKISPRVLPINIFKDIYVQDLTHEKRNELDMQDWVSGVIITKVVEGSPAARLLAKDDVIMELNKKDIRSIKDFYDIASRIEQAQDLLILKYKNGGAMYVTIPSNLSSIDTFTQPIPEANKNLELVTSKLLDNYDKIKKSKSGLRIRKAGKDLSQALFSLGLLVEGDCSFTVDNELVGSIGYSSKLDTYIPLDANKKHILKISKRDSILVLFEGFGFASFDFELKDDQEGVFETSEHCNQNNFINVKSWNKRQ